jgi:hypothetical protein
MGGMLQELLRLMDKKTERNTLRQQAEEKTLLVHGRPRSS